MRFFVFVFTSIPLHICNVNIMQVQKQLRFYLMKSVNNIKSNASQLLLAVVLVVMATLSLSAQSKVAGWEKTYPFVGEEFSEARSMTQTRDLGFVFINQDNVDRFRIVKTDPDGHIIWVTDELSGLTSVDAREILETSTGEFVIVATCSNCGVQAEEKNVIIYRLKDNGAEIGAPQIIDFPGADNITSYIGRSIKETLDGGFIIGGEVNTTDLEEQAYFIKLDAGGNIEYQKIYGGEGRETINEVIETPDGFIAAGSIDIAGDADVYLISLNAQGDSIWSAAYGNSAVNQGFGIAPSYDSNQEIDGYVVAGYTVSMSTGLNVYLVEVATNGDEISTKVLTDGELSEQAFDIVNTNDGGYILTGTIEPNPLQTRLLLMKLNSETDVEWEKDFGQPNQTDFAATQGLNVVQTKDEGYAVAGFQSDPDDFDKTYSYFLKTDSQGQIFSNYLAGRVFNNATNVGIEDWIVVASEQGGQGRNFYATSDEDGNYELLVTMGTFDVFVRTPNDYWEPSIGFTTNISLPYSNQTFDFPINPIVNCTDLEVDISAPSAVRGQTNIYTVKYCNNGTETALDAFVEVSLDEDILLLNSSISNEDLGDNKFRFQIGNLPFGDCGAFTINTVLQTSAMESATECVEAEIFPNTFCDVDPAWNGASVEVEAACLDGVGIDPDTVRFNIKNTGAALMASASGIIITEDHIMRLDPPSTIQLGAGEEEEILLPSLDGATYRIIAQQVDGHPGDSRPTVAIEGCGGLHPGFYTSFPEDDYNYSNEFDCQENTDVSLSNVKRSYPKGAGDSLKIAANADLIYHLKFQNIGQDTAIRVVIRDTISPYLDPSQIRPGASSHDYNFEVYAGGILKFTFEDINLPGSSTDEFGSHIFVKYRISQKPNNEVGTPLNNGTAITFEYNEPEILESDPRVIGGLEVQEFLVTSDKVFHPEVEQLSVYPNPFTDEATFELKSDVNFQNLTFTLFDVTGRMVRKSEFSGNTFTLRKDDMTAGMYVFRIEAEGVLISTGKIVAQ